MSQTDRKIFNLGIQKGLEVRYLEQKAYYGLLSSSP